MDKRIKDSQKSISALVEEINLKSQAKRFTFQQQKIKTTNISITGGNGRLRIQIAKNHYHISLSGLSLEKEMYSFMESLCEKKHDGFKHPFSNPFWKVNDFNLVRKAAYHYAGLEIDYMGNELLPEEIIEPDRYIEGASKTVSVNAYERNPKARKKCLEHHGFQCTVCLFDFETVYGSRGKEFIHVHHITPLAEKKEEYILDPIKDLVPVCPNCHAMIHRTQPVLTVDELRKHLHKN